MERTTEGGVSQSFGWVFVFVLDFLPVVDRLKLLYVFGI
jgi:hypothetical protein